MPGLSRAIYRCRAGVAGAVMTSNRLRCVEGVNLILRLCLSKSKTALKC